MGMEAVSYTHLDVYKRQLQTIAMTRFPENRHGTAMGVAGIALGFAPNMGPVIGGALCEATGWRTMFLILSSVSLVLFVLTLALVREREVKDLSLIHI